MGGLNWHRPPGTETGKPANARKVRIMRIARFIFLFALAAGIMAIPAPSRAQVAVGVSIRIGPPALPVYVQPICPGPGYIWIPGYWAYGPDGYFWVPGTDRKSTRLNSSHGYISYAVFCLQKQKHGFDEALRPWY